MYQDTFALYLI